MKHVAGLALLLGIALAPGPLRAQAWPERPITLVVPYAPGGYTDLTARLTARYLEKALGKPIVVDSRPGAGGIVGTQAVASAAPDGYTFCVCSVGAISVAPFAQKVGYDPIKDLAPVSIISTIVQAVVVKKALPVTTMAELVAYAKKQNAPLQYTTGGIGSYGHLWWEMFRARQGIDGQHVAYNGIAPALKDVVGGQVPLLIDAIVPTGAQVKAGAVRGLAIVTAQRAKSLPDVRTLTEQGYAGLDAAPFYGILGPANLDPAAQQRLSETLQKALAMPALRDKLQEQGFDVVGSSPDAYAKLIRDEIERWTKVVQASGIKVE